MANDGSMPARQDCARFDFCQAKPRASLGYDFFISTLPHSIADLQQRLDAEHYVADRGLAVSLFLALRLKRPLFLEGEAGVGKTALAAAMARVLETDLIRLQCYEGLDIGHAVYEWDYPRQLLELRILDATHSLDREHARRELDRKSTRLNSSHLGISYAVFCLKKKKNRQRVNQKAHESR